MKAGSHESFQIKTRAAKLFHCELKALYGIHIESGVVIGTREHFDVTNLYKLFLS